MTDVRDMTRRLPNCARSPISSSVIPSVKYSWAGSLERFPKGKTAMELNCFAGRAAFTVASGERNGHRMRTGNFENIAMKATPKSITEAKPSPKILQRELEFC